MGRAIRVILIGVLGLVLVAAGFSGGFIAGHSMSRASTGSTAFSAAAPAATLPASAQTATPEDLQDLFKPFWEAWKIVPAVTEA